MFYSRALPEKQFGRSVLFRGVCIEFSLIFLQFMYFHSKNSFWGFEPVTPFNTPIVLGFNSSKALIRGDLNP